MDTADFETLNSPGAGLSILKGRIKVRTKQGGGTVAGELGVFNVCHPCCCKSNVETTFALGTNPL